MSVVVGVLVLLIWASVSLLSSRMILRTKTGSRVLARIWFGAPPKKSARLGAEESV